MGGKVAPLQVYFVSRLLSPVPYSTFVSYTLE